MDDETTMGVSDGTDVRDRMERMRSRLQPLTIPGSGAGIFYGPTDPFDVELRVEFDDGATLNRVIVPLTESDLLFLQEQVDDVRRQQRRVANPDGDDGDMWRDMAVEPTSRRYAEDSSAVGQRQASVVEADAGGDDEIADGKWTRRMRKAGDPMGFKPLLNSIPSRDQTLKNALIAVVVLVVLIGGIASLI